MFIETPEARALAPVQAKARAGRVPQGERFVISLHRDGLWQFEDRQGEYERRLFVDRRYAQLYRLGIRAYLWGDEDLSGLLLEHTTYEAQHRR